ncbi:RNA polymerase sigma factor [Rubinisphaera margarita]|uniref:RNA polymerase sigma factor n=1 Tax=Rubinisphaera margarita TaxID=2909586 RepID=UPI001EE81D00|nr:sigma-70 family RNA polymerase sigma factor [Rubinisphaera margarita]MCG6154645.1 sigma-70 family RNA polymerase sigma factor [Rubinisphaera margarita]
MSTWNSTDGESTISNETLLLARQCDSDSWYRIWSVYRERVFRQALRSGLRQRPASEITVEVFSHAFENLEQFSREQRGQSLGKWLRTLTFHCIIDHVRKRKAGPVNIGSWADAIPNQVSETSLSEVKGPTLEQMALATAIAELEEEYARKGRVEHWDCFWSHFVNGQSSGEVARRMDKSVSYVTTTSSRVKKRLTLLTQMKLDEIKQNLNQSN